MDLDVSQLCVTEAYILFVSSRADQEQRRADLSLLLEVWYLELFFFKWKVFYILMIFIKLYGSMTQVTYAFLDLYLILTNLKK